MNRIKLTKNRVIDLPDGCECGRNRCFMKNKEDIFIAYYDVKRDWEAQLLHVSGKEIHNIDFPKIISTENDLWKDRHEPIIFDLPDKAFGAVLGRSALCIWENEKSKAQIITIENSEIFNDFSRPFIFNLRRCFFQNGKIIVPIENGKACHCSIAIINFNFQTNRAFWESIFFMPLASNKCSEHNEVVGDVIIDNNEFLIFTEGVEGTSVNKWGMEFYHIGQYEQRKTMEVKNELVLKNTYFEQTNLKQRSMKKDGVFGIFTSSLDYLILRSWFSESLSLGTNQKLWSVIDKEFVDIEFPKGTRKYVLADACKDGFLMSTKGKILLCDFE